jgi:tetratricopeptide (TPR) repeat protein
MFEKRMNRTVQTLLLVWFAVSSALGQGVDLKSAYYHYSLGKIHHLNKNYSLAVGEFERALESDPSSVPLRVEFAKTLLEMGEISRAVEMCSKAAELEPQNADPRYLLGRIYFQYRRQEGMHEKAVAEYEKVLEIEPDHLDTLNDLAQIRWEERDYKSAAELFHRVREVNPYELTTYYFEAQALIELARIDEAIDVLERGLSIRNDVPDYVLLLGRLYEETGNLEAAAALYRQGSNEGANPRVTQRLAQVLMETGSTKEAIPVLEDLVITFPQKAELKLDLAVALRRERRASEAVELLEELLEENPEDIQAQYELANSMVVRGQRDEAISRFESLVQLPGKDAGRYRDVFRTRLALLYEESGRYDEAIELLEGILEEKPGDVDSQLRLFYALKQAQKTGRSLDLTDSLMKEHPDNPYVVIARAQALSADGQLDRAAELLKDRINYSDDPELFYVAASQIYMSHEQYLGARKLVEKGLASYPDSSPIRFQLGAVLERLKDYEAAEMEFKKVLGENPDDATALNYLGYMLADQGIRLDEALGYIERAVELDPYNGAYLDSLGWVYYKQNRLEEAEAHLKEAARINQSDPVILEHLGDLYVRKGQHEDAVDCYRRSLRVAENEEESERVREKLSDLEQAVSKHLTE